MRPWIESAAARCGWVRAVWPRAWRQMAGFPDSAACGRPRLDHDRRDVFAALADWIEPTRLERATFHILTPYPRTPLFRKLEAEGRLLHRDWSLYDTAHVVFRPQHMSPEELAHGYAWLCQRLFSLTSIWRRRPADPAAVPPYLVMSYLYKRSNNLWRFLIRSRLVRAAWHPIVEWTRRRHVRFRAKLAARPVAGTGCEEASVSVSVVSAGV